MNSSSNACVSARFKSRRLLDTVLFIVLLQASLRLSHSAVPAAGEVSFTAKSAGSNGEYQAPAMDPDGWEVRKFEQVQRCLACRYVQETAAGSTYELSTSSKVFGKIMSETCPSLPSFLRAPCNDASAAITRLEVSAAPSDVCHAAGACSVPLLDPFETAKLLASPCQPPGCTIYHHVSGCTSAARVLSHNPPCRCATALRLATCPCCPHPQPRACRASPILYLV
jgi:hypothetical protein